MLEWICHFRPVYPHWEGPEYTPFTSTMRNMFAKGALASLGNFVIAVLCRPQLIVGTAVTELGNLNAMRVIGSKVARANSRIKRRRHHYRSIYITRIKRNVANNGQPVPSTSSRKWTYSLEGTKYQAQTRRNKQPWVLSLRRTFSFVVENLYPKKTGS